jgi:hypothetical protein
MVSGSLNAIRLAEAAPFFSGWLMLFKAIGFLVER